MRLGTRKVLDFSFTGLGYVSIILMVLSVLVLLAPIFVKGMGAMLFRGTIEYRELMYRQFGRGDEVVLRAEQAQVRIARAPVYAAIAAFREELPTLPSRQRRELRDSFEEVEDAVKELLGPLPGEPEPVLMRQKYGQTRWDRALVKQHAVLYAEEWDTSDPTKMGVKVYVPRATNFAGTALAPLFPQVATNLVAMLQPRWTFYWHFLTDKSYDAHFFGGIMPEILGTFYLATGAMIFALPLGVLAAVYLVEYAPKGRIVGFLRTCMSTLAGVPSIVFGLFGLAFFINTVHVSDSKSVLAGSLTLSLLILPTIIRASEEALRAVPQTYREASLGLGASRWHSILTVILPAALPGILTGIVISMGRAAGETAPIIFTAAVSVGKPLTLLQTLNQPTPALSWNIYNLCTEHESVEEIRHVQYGMVFVLVALVLLLNLAAILLRARIVRRMRA
jgi:phosphate transport system permease protein